MNFRRLWYNLPQLRQDAGVGARWNLGAGNYKVQVHILLLHCEVIGELVAGMAGVDVEGNGWSLDVYMLNFIPSMSACNVIRLLVDCTFDLAIFSAEKD